MLAGGRLGWGKGGRSTTCIIHRPHYPASRSIRLQADTATQAGGMPPEFPAPPLTPCKGEGTQCGSINVHVNLHAEALRHVFERTHVQQCASLRMAKEASPNFN